MFDFAQNIAEQAVPTLELQACMSYPKLMRLFLGLFLFFVVVLGGLMAGAVAAAGHFLHWDITAWTDTSAWNSRSIVVGAVILALSTMAASVMTLAWRFVISLIGGASKPKKKIRAQSNRRTTT